ncbi:VCBS repeat-containing protein [Candidatus Bipolaricaulota bacterium]|nr:VCBS repeat-containing protein [Candidatus Bipolaricaulota bacterium]
MNRPKLQLTHRSLVSIMLATMLLLAASHQPKGDLFSKGSPVGDSRSWAVALADLDEDGDLDALVANATGGSKLWINDGNAAFAEHEQRLPNARAAQLADIDGDSSPDILLADWSGPFLVWRNNRDGTFSEVPQDQQFGGAIDMALADLDGDGDLDAVLGRSGPDVILLNNGFGVFTDTGQRLGTSISAEVELGDMDLDGDMDVVVDGWDGDGHVWLNDGAAMFSSNYPLTGPDWHVNGLALGDLDDDGDLDALLVSSLYDSHQVWLNNGAGLLVDSGQRLDAPDGYGAQLGDLDNDGDLDAVVIVGGEPRIGIAVWMNHEGRFVSVHIEAEEALGRDVALGDLDSDGDLDVFAAFLEYRGGFQPRPNRIWLNSLY